MNLYRSLWAFLKNPVYKKDENTEPKYRWTVFFLLLILSLTVAMGWGMILLAAETLFGFEMGEHALDKAFEDYSMGVILILVVVVAPVSEELIFRGPLSFFKDKPYFKTVFWVLTLLFGYVHLSNYELTTSIVIFSLFLVLPQIALGAILGFLRVRFSLLWAIGLHAAYNLVLTGPILLMSAFDIPLLAE